MSFDFSSSPVQQVNHPAADAAGIKWYVKRDDLYGPGKDERPLQGNKVRKLKGYLKAWQEYADSSLGILSFGGAFSNHLIALAVAGKRYGIRTIGVVRGEKVDNPTLNACKSLGMQLHFVSRGKYRQKHLPDELLAYKQQFGAVIIIPEGGSGPECQLGCKAILPETSEQLDKPIDYFQLAAGTGGTAAGLIHGATEQTTQIEVFPVLKGGWMQAEIEQQLSAPVNVNWKVIDGYHFGGYAKRPVELLDFCTHFSEQYHVPLEPIYTGKLFFGVLARIKAGIYPAGSTLVTYHSGGIY